MTAITEANQFYTTPYAVFRLWADYWASTGSDVPPLHHYKSTMSGAFLFVAPLSPPQLAEFLEWASRHQDLVFQSEGAALLDEMRWLGHWGCFSAQVRALRSVRRMPPQVPKLPK
jgi:hypothetical protein